VVNVGRTVATRWRSLVCISTQLFQQFLKGNLFVNILECFLNLKIHLHRLGFDCLVGLCLVALEDPPEQLLGICQDSTVDF
jgi:hypothetical protein